MSWLPTQLLSIIPSELKCCDESMGPMGSEEGHNPPGVSKEGSMEEVCLSQGLNIEPFIF